MNKHQIKAYLKHKRRAKYRKGHSIHPPFAFDLVRHYFFEKHPYYHFDEIEEIRQALLKNKQLIEIEDLGAGSKVFKSNKRKIGQIAKYNTTPKKQGELISRLVCCLKPKTIIELGTSLGIGTLYLAKPNSKAKVHTIEGCRNIAGVAQSTFAQGNIKNIEQHIGTFENQLPKVLQQLETIDMVYFDGHHGYDATINYFNICRPKASNSAIFIFDDINWSKEMNAAWTKIIEHPCVSISFDLFRFGIAILNLDVHKQNYKVSWP